VGKRRSERLAQDDQQNEQDQHDERAIIHIGKRHARYLLASIICSSLCRVLRIGPSNEEKFLYSVENEPLRRDPLE
jgi:hypothetical protein